MGLGLGLGLGVGLNPVNQLSFELFVCVCRRHVCLFLGPKKKVLSLSVLVYGGVDRGMGWECVCLCGYREKRPRFQDQRLFFHLFIESTLYSI